MSHERSLHVQALHTVETTAPLTYTSLDKGIILNDTTPCIQVHLHVFKEGERRDYVNKARVLESLGNIAHYASLRAPLYKPEYVIGLTHMKVGHLASKLFGFDLITDIPVSDYPEEVIELRAEYNQPLCMAIMTVDTLIEKYDTGDSTPTIRDSADRANLVDRISILAHETAAMYDSMPSLGVTGENIMTSGDIITL